MKFISIQKKIASLTTRMLMTTLGIVLLGGVVYLLVDARKNMREIESKYEAELIKKGMVLATTSKIALRELARSNAIADIREIVANTVDMDNDLLYGIFTDGSGKPWTVVVRPERLREAGKTLSRLSLDSLGHWTDRIPDAAYRTFNIGAERAIEFAAPIGDAESGRLGTIRYACSTLRISDAEAASKRKLLLGLSLFVAVSLAAIVMLFRQQRRAAYRQARAITQPLVELTNAAVAMSSGNSSAPLCIAADDEIGILAEKFDEMRHTIRQYTDNLESIVEQRTEQLNEAQREKMVQADKLATLGTLVASVAHEINNPNNAILLSMTTLREIWEGLVPILDRHSRTSGPFTVGRYSYEELRSDTTATFGRVIKNAQRIEGFVRDLKNFARKDSDEPLKDVDINEAVRSAIRIIESEIRRSTNRFSAVYGEGLPRIKGVQRHFEQIVMNLIQNACHALPHADAAIGVATLFDPQDDKLMICVSDKGRGMPPEILKKVFSPFFTTRAETGGTGLGLTVSLRIAKSYGGSIVFDSFPDRGTTATVLIPVSPKGGHP